MKKQQIIKMLKRFGRMTSTQVATMVGVPYGNGKKYLEELKQEKLIIEEKETNATYWRLNK